MVNSIANSSIQHSPGKHSPVMVNSIASSSIQHSSGRP
jgi:hypothetical protein